MNPAIPKYHETFNVILQQLRNNEVIKRRELIKAVIKNNYADLPIELLSEKLQSGGILIENRIAWGISYLKSAGYIDYPQRGMIQITSKGLTQTNPLTLNQIKLETALIRTNDNHQTIREDVDSPTVSLTPQDLIERGVSEIKYEIKNELLEKLKALDPYYFEKVILILLKKMGYGDFIETSKSVDGGIDGIINEDKLGLDKIYIQAKRFVDAKVREKDIRNFIGAMSGDTNKGVFVTTSFFDKGAEIKAHNAHHKIILIDGNKLVDLMYEYNVGIQVKSTYEVKHLDEDFFIEE